MSNFIFSHWNKLTLLFVLQVVDLFEQQYICLYIWKIICIIYFEVLNCVELCHLVERWLCCIPFVKTFELVEKVWHNSADAMQCYSCWPAADIMENIIILHSLVDVTFFCKNQLDVNKKPYGWELILKQKYKLCYDSIFIHINIILHFSQLNPCS